MQRLLFIIEKIINVGSISVLVLIAVFNSMKLLSLVKFSNPGIF